MNDGNDYSATANENNFIIKPGTYLITSARANGKISLPRKTGELGMDEFAAPQSFSKEPFVTHIPYSEVSPGKSFTINAKIVGVDDN